VDEFLSFKFLKYVALNYRDGAKLFLNGTTSVTVYLT